MLIRLIPAVAATAFCGLAAWQVVVPPSPRLLYNATESAPKGWYIIDRSPPFGRDDLVASDLPKEARTLAEERGYIASGAPLIKTIWAETGDEICSRNGRAFTSGRPALVVLSHDSAGRRLPPWDGCQTLSEDEVFLVSDDVQTSFDSRYFGPVRRSDVLGIARLVGGQGEREKPDQGGARGRGAEGKIKGGGAPDGATPCLHIFSGGAPQAEGSAPKCAASGAKVGPSGSTPCPEDHAASHEPVR